MLMAPVYTHPGTQHTSPNGISKSPRQAKTADFSGLRVGWKILENVCRFSIILLEYRSPLVAKTVAGRCPWELEVYQS